MSRKYLPACVSLLLHNLTFSFNTIHSTEKTYLLCNVKYHCAADLLFEWFGFDQTYKSPSNSTQAKQLNPNQSNRRSVVQWYFPLWSKWVFSVFFISPFYFINSTRFNLPLFILRTFNLSTNLSLRIEWIFAPEDKKNLDVFSAESALVLVHN